MRMRSTAPMRTAKIGYIVISVLFCILGVMLIVIPSFSAKLLGVICGILMLLFGVVKITGYFSKDLYRLAFQYDLPLGILLIVIGVLTLTRPEGLMTVLCVTMGLYILADGLFKVQIALDAKRFGIRKWWLILASAFFAGVCGILLMLRPGDGGRLLTVIFGITLLFEGVLNFSTVITAVKIIKNQIPDVIELDDYEERED